VLITHQYRCWISSCAIMIALDKGKENLVSCDGIILIFPRKIFCSWPHRLSNVLCDDVEGCQQHTLVSDNTFVHNYVIFLKSKCQSHNCANEARFDGCSLLRMPVQIFWRIGSSMTSITFSNVFHSRHERFISKTKWVRLWSICKFLIVDIIVKMNTTYTYYSPLLFRIILQLYNSTLHDNSLLEQTRIT